MDSGLYDFRKELVQRLLHDSFDVVIVAPFVTYKKRFERMGCVCVHSKIERRGMNPVKDFVLLQFYRKCLREYKPDVVLTYTIKPNIYGGIACQIEKIPYLANVTGLGTSLTGTSKLKDIIGTLYKIGLRGARCVFFQNEYNRTFMQGKGYLTGTNRLLMGSGVNLSEFPYQKYPSEEPIQMLTIGRIMKDKGIGELLAVIPKICKEFSSVVFVLLGAYEKEDEEYFQPIIENLQKEGSLRYYGYKENARDYIRQAQALIHPSYHEGMSNVMLEAAATGRPIVASDIPGCREIVKDRTTGVLCQAKDADSLYESIKLLLLKSSEERAQMGKKAREHVTTSFDREQIVEAYLEEIKSILNE